MAWCAHPPRSQPIRAACGDRVSSWSFPASVPDWAASGDQKRITTPRQARDRGARYAGDRAADHGRRRPGSRRRGANARRNLSLTGP